MPGGLTLGGNQYYEEEMRDPDSIDTVQLDAADHETEWVGEKGDRNGYYRLSKAQKQIEGELTDWWSQLEPDADDGAPVTLQDKQARPYDRNYPTKDQVREASKRLFKK